MLSKTFSATPQGIDGALIQIEAAVQPGNPGVRITGLPSEIIRESRERVKACLRGMGYDVPSEFLIVHLSPAQTRKQGSQLDLGIAMAILEAERLLPKNRLAGVGLLGELSLDGRIHGVSSAVALIEALERAREVGTVLVPLENAAEAALVGAKKVKVVGHISEAIAYLEGREGLAEPRAVDFESPARKASLDEVVGQDLAKRALQIAVAGNHHLMLVGPPGVGKSLIAQCAPDLLPPLTREERIEVAKSYGVLAKRDGYRMARPFRAPHHSISAGALLGGGSGVVIPGEVTLAHTGVLFLDEFPEFRQDALEGLREPLQNGVIHLHRVGQALSLPARFTLIAAMNPCPCGYALERLRRCTCTGERLAAYRRKTSGPILDRIDLRVHLTAPRPGVWTRSGPSHEELEAGIATALAVKKARGEVASKVDLEDPIYRISASDRAWLDEVVAREALSFRSLHKLMRVARTIADLAAQPEIESSSLREAWGLLCQVRPVASYA